MKLLFKIKKSKLILSDKNLGFGILIGFLALVIQKLTITYLTYHTFLALGFIIAYYNYIKNKPEFIE